MLGDREGKMTNNVYVLKLNKDISHIHHVKSISRGVLIDRLCSDYHNIFAKKSHTYVAEGVQYFINSIIYDLRMVYFHTLPWYIYVARIILQIVSLAAI